LPLLSSSISYDPSPSVFECVFMPIDTPSCLPNKKGNYNFRRLICPPHILYEIDNNLCDTCYIFLFFSRGSKFVIGYLNIALFKFYTSNSSRVFPSCKLQSITHNGYISQKRREGLDTFVVSQRNVTSQCSASVFEFVSQDVAYSSWNCGKIIEILLQRWNK